MSTSTFLDHDFAIHVAILTISRFAKLRYGIRSTVQI
jgi:hypothetical protein